MLADGFVSIVGLHAGEWACFFGEHAVIVEWRKDWQMIAAADNIVIDAVARRGVNAAGTCIEGDVGAVDDEAVTIEEWMAADKVFEVFAEPFSFNGVIFWQADLLDDGFNEFFCKNVALAIKIQQLIFKFRIQADGFVGWQGPWGGCPDHEVCIFSGEFSLGVGDFEAHIDGWRFFFAVFDLGFSESGVAVWAPVNWFSAFIDVAFLGHFAKNADLAGFKFWFQREIWMFPIAANAEAFETFALNVHIFHGVIGTGIAETDDVFALGIKAGVFDGFELDRQPMGVPAWNVWRVIALDGFGFNDDVLEDFVHGVAKMDLTVGIWRAVVEHEFFVTGVLFLDLVVDIDAVPEFQDAWFIFWQIATHWKIGFRQVQCFAVFFFFFVFVGHVFTSYIK